MDLKLPTFEIKLEDKGLEGLLLTIAKHGKVRLNQFADGAWVCLCEMRVNSAGVSFEIKSDFNHKTVVPQFEIRRSVAGDNPHPCGKPW